MINEVVENHDGYRIDWDPDERFMVWCYWAGKYVGSDLANIEQARRFVKVLEDAHDE